LNSPKFRSDEVPKEVLYDERPERSRKLTNDLVIRQYIRWRTIPAAQKYIVLKVKEAAV